MRNTTRYEVLLTKGQASSPNDHTILSKEMYVSF
jgi:hypothetical protein